MLIERIALYRLYNAAGELLYVGIAQNPVTRLRQHARTKSRWPEVAGDPVVRWFTCRQAALVAEGKAIANESPRYNRRPGASSAGWKRPGGRLDIRRKSFGHRVTQAERSPLIYVEDGQPLVALVPIGWYRVACDAAGDPVSDADLEPRPADES